MSKQMDQKLNLRWGLCRFFTTFEEDLIKQSLRPQTAKILKINSRQTVPKLLKKSWITHLFDKMYRRCISVSGEDIHRVMELIKSDGYCDIITDQIRTYINIQLFISNIDIFGENSDMNWIEDNEQRAKIKIVKELCLIKSKSTDVITILASIVYQLVPNIDRLHELNIPEIKQIFLANNCITSIRSFRKNAYRKLEYLDLSLLCLIQGNNKIVKLNCLQEFSNKQLSKMLLEWNDSNAIGQSLNWLAKMRSSFFKYMRVESYERIREYNKDQMLHNRYPNIKIWRKPKFSS